tara:strand:- start:702 stop:1352 length:651 start_codon:yes stop_codon:yes gene_type:complete
MTSCLLFQPNFKEIWAKNSKQQYDVIIVPGIPFEPPTWNPIMKMRVHWSAYLYKQGIAKNIIYSGGAVHSPYLESKIMSLYAQKLGVPKENIYLESKAEHGSENLFYSTVLADSLGFEKIALATDVYQGSLMFKHNRKFDLNLPFLPAMMDTLITLDMYMPEIDYEQAKVENFVKLNERVGKIEQYQNSMGRRIKKESKARKKAKKRAKKEVKTTN